METDLSVNGDSTVISHGSLFAKTFHHIKTAGKVYGQESSNLLKRLLANPKKDFDIHNYVCNLKENTLFDTEPLYY